MERYSDVLKKFKGSTLWVGLINEANPYITIGTNQIPNGRRMRVMAVLEDAIMLKDDDAAEIYPLSLVVFKDQLF